jgi:hypothetical protein
MLVGMQLFEVGQSVWILGIETEHFVERFESPVDEAATLEIEAKTEQHMGLLEFAEVWSLEQRLMNPNRATDLTFFAIEVPEHDMHFERIAMEGCGLAEFVDGQIDLVRYEKIETEQIVGRLPTAATIDNAAVGQLVALPGFAGSEAEEQSQERSQKRGVRAHACYSQIDGGAWKKGIVTARR